MTRPGSPPEPPPPYNHHSIKTEHVLRPTCQARQGGAPFRRMRPFLRATKERYMSTSDRRAFLHAIVTRDGNPSLLKAAGIPYSQLGRLPK